MKREGSFNERWSEIHYTISSVAIKIILNIAEIYTTFIIVSSVPFSVQWYAICGIILGCLAFLVGISAVAYRCFRKYNDDQSSDNRPLSSAIKKGLKESNNGSMKQSTSLKSMGSINSRGSMSSGGGAGPLLQGQQTHDVTIPEKGIRKSPSGQQSIDATQIKTECYIENEKEGAVSPVEKEETMREKSIDDLKIAKLGTLQFVIEYDKVKTALVVTISQANDLPAKDPNVGSSDPYVKLQLLPEKRHKVKTRVLRKTLNPVYDEIFTFYGINHNQLQGITLHFVMLSFDRFSRDDIIGEVIHPLSGLELGEKEISVCKEISPRHIKVSTLIQTKSLVSVKFDLILYLSHSHSTILNLLLSSISIFQHQENLAIIPILM